MVIVINKRSKVPRGYLRIMQLLPKKNNIEWQFNNYMILLNKLIKENDFLENKIHLGMNDQENKMNWYSEAFKNFVSI